MNIFMYPGPKELLEALSEWIVNNIPLIGDTLAGFIQWIIDSTGWVL